MNKWGQALLWIAVVGCGAAIYLSARALATRTAWMAKAQKLESEYEENQKVLLAKRLTLSQSRSELARVMLNWDRHWSDIPTQAVDKGLLQPEIGTDRGIQNKQVLHLFAPNADGSSSYVGAFRVTTARPDRSALEPTWRLRPGDITLTGKPNLRIRSMVPAHFASRINELEIRFLLAEEVLAGNQRELEREKQLTQVAEDHLKLRLGEINGVPELEGKTLPPEIIKGFLTVMVEEEEERNTVMLEVDRLLRALKKARDEFAATIETNKRLMKTLPQPAPRKDGPPATAKR